MIKFTDEQKRELLTEYKELHKKTVEYIKEKDNIEAEAFYYVKREKLIEEVEKDLTKFDDEDWGYIFVYSLLNYCSKNASGFSHTKWTSIIGLLNLFCGEPTLPNDDKVS